MFVLDSVPSVGNEFLRELRDAGIQQDRLRFRKNVERLGEIMAYEVSKALVFHPDSVVTPLGIKRMHVMKSPPVLITILRAGLPFFQGFANFFDHADCGFIGAFRKEDEQQMTIKLEYLATPSVAGRVVLLIDPMLATGRSVLDSIRALKRNGMPDHIHVVSLVAAPEGVKYLNENLQMPFTLWTCSLDEKLNELFYIVPGLGDAGDLSFGDKV